MKFIKWFSELIKKKDIQQCTVKWLATELTIIFASPKDSP